MHLIIDSHEDLAWNMLALGRDYTTSAAERRVAEATTQAPVWNGVTLLGWPDYQRGNVAVVFGTLFATPRRRLAHNEAWDRVFYEDDEQAHRWYSAELDAYHRLVEEHPQKFRLILERADLEAVLADWTQPRSGNEGDATHPVGLVVLMEGAEGVRRPEELEEWWQRGVSVIGPAWAGTRFCGGTREPGGLTRDGQELLEHMAGFGFTLDLSHMDAKAALQALDRYPGPIISSHANPLAMLKGSESNRHLPDAVIDGLIERDGVLGIMPHNRFLRANWSPEDGKDAVSLRDVVAHIDYVCQRAGDARHVGLGSDFDGGFGVQGTPQEIDTVADLQKLAPLLAEKGYNEEDVAAILGGNWRAHLEKHLPEKR